MAKRPHASNPQSLWTLLAMLQNIAACFRAPWDTSSAWVRALDLLFYCKRLDTAVPGVVNVKPGWCTDLQKASMGKVFGQKSVVSRQHVPCSSRTSILDEAGHIPQYIKH
jgi:hypothetical protein